MTNQENAIRQFAENQTRKTSSRVVQSKTLHIDASAFPKRSDSFHLMLVPVGSLPMIFAQGAGATGPLVVDRNFRNIGKLQASGFVPPVIVVSGTDQLKAAKENRTKTVRAWVGGKAVKQLKLQAAAAISNSDLEQKLNDLVRDAYTKKVSPVVAANMPYAESPYVMDVFQGNENYCVFRQGKAYWKQNFKVDDNRNIVLDGTRSQVVRSWQDAPTGDLSSAAYDTGDVTAPITTTTLQSFLYPQTPSPTTLGSKLPTGMIVPAFGIDFIHYGAPNSELNNPQLKLMSNVEEALQQYFSQVGNGTYKPVGQLGQVSAPLYANAIAETKIVLGEFHNDVNRDSFPYMDFLRWQDRQLKMKASAQTKIVDGNVLTHADFAYVGDKSDISTWHLPIASPAYIRSSLQAASSCTAIPKFERHEVREKLNALAKDFGIKR